MFPAISFATESRPRKWLCDIKQSSVRRPVPLETDKFHRSTGMEGVRSSTTAKTVA